MAAACFGFLPFNFPIARVFLGDVGSYVLGASVVGLAFLAYTEGKWTPLEIICLFSALLIDTLLTFLRRGLRGFSVMHAHRSHLYQYAVRCGQSHVIVCIYYAIWTLIALMIIIISRHLPELAQRLLLITLIMLGCMLHEGSRLFLLNSRKLK